MLLTAGARDGACGRAVAAHIDERSGCGTRAREHTSPRTAGNTRLVSAASARLTDPSSGATPARHTPAGTIRASRTSLLRHQQVTPKPAPKPRVPATCSPTPSVAQLPACSGSAAPNQAVRSPACPSSHPTRFLGVRWISQRRVHSVCLTGKGPSACPGATAAAGVRMAGRKPPFALWVENVDPLRVDAKDLWEAFARYGDMCKPREHGARAVEILPEQKAAIVNFASYEHACNALKGLQGALIGKLTRPGLSLAWHKRQEEQVRPQPVQQTASPGQKDPPFFGLWVGNVHPSLVQEDELRGAFERYGELCSLQLHGVAPVIVLPESSSAFVNFARHEDATQARKGLQGKLAGGAGPLRINASDLMQEYEQHQQQRRAPLQLQRVLHLPQTAGKSAGNQKLMYLDSSNAMHLGPYHDIEEMCGEDGPLYELLGGEIFVYEAGDQAMLFEMSQVHPAHQIR